MGKFYAFLLGILAGFGLYHVASSYHIVRAETGFHMTPKLVQSLDQTYVDVRGFGPSEWAEHTALAAAIAKSGDDALIESAAKGAVDKALEEVLPGVVEE